MEKEYFNNFLQHSLINQDITTENQFLEPKLITNNKNNTLWEHLKFELLHCKSFTWTVAFITADMLVPLKAIMQDLISKNVHGTIITGTYLGFNSPTIFQELLKLPNVEIKISQDEGFHPKGYLFKYDHYQTAYIGSANFTRNALLKNVEWNMRITSLNNGAFLAKLTQEIEDITERTESLSLKWIHDYEKNYQKPLLQTSSSRSSKQAIKPNKMQLAALNELSHLYQNHAKKALVVSATGTGKTYLAAFWAKQFKPKKFLFLVHREQILQKAKQSFQKIIQKPNTDFGILSGQHHNTHAKYVFATVQTLSQNQTLNQFDPAEFDLIIIDEAHHASATSYQKIMQYFTPKFYLGMTATPERMDEQNIFELFDYNLAYEIRLRDALDAKMLCPFHYVGVSDFEYQNQIIDELTPLKYLTSDQRVNYILDELNYYTDSSMDIHGLIFCSRTKEAEKLAEIFNQHHHPARALTNNSSAKFRQKVVQELEKGKIEYIITIDLFNEGIDIPCLNQIIMLRNTQSSTIFTQQLGRGLRKYPGKDFVTIIDFIGNYKNNYLIPIALYGNTNMQKDDIKKDLLTHTVIDISTINFTKIAQKRILDSLEKIKLNSLMTLKNAYINLSNKLDKVPTLLDFEKYSDISASLFIENQRLDNYAKFLLKMNVEVELSSYQQQVLTFITKELANGKRVQELLLLLYLIKHQTISFNEFHALLKERRIYFNHDLMESIISVLSLQFFDVKAGKTTRKALYGDTSLIEYNLFEISLSSKFQTALHDAAFKALVLDTLQTGLLLNQKYDNSALFTKYQKYSRKDVCRLLNWPKDVSAPLYGYRVTDTVCPIFITLKKDDLKKRNARYQNNISANSIIKWYTRSPRHLSSPEVQKLLAGVDQGNPQVKIYLFIKSSDSEGKDFTYVGTGHILPHSAKEISLTDYKGKAKSTVEMQIKIDPPLVLSEIQELFE